MRTIRLALLMLCCLAALGCGASRPSPASPPPGLPALPAEPGAPGVAVPQHAASGAVTVVIPGAEFYLKSDNANVSGTSLNLSVGSGQVVWAIYKLEGLGEDYYPTGFSTVVAPIIGEYWLALANYDRGSWEYLEPPRDASVSLSLPGAWSSYRSPSGCFYVALLVSGGSFVLNQLAITVSDTRPLPAPTGLSATAGDAAASFTWDLYPDARASELRLYTSDDVDLAGAVLHGTYPPGQTSAALTGLINGATYYCVLTAYCADDALESPDSNVALVTPQAGTGAGLEGLWPRLGCTADGAGRGSQPGPPSFSDYVSVALGGSARGANRTSPVIDKDGHVYALARDGRLLSYTSDLASRRWEFKASDHGDAGGTYVCPPHSPAIGADGRVYFIALGTGATPATPYVFAVDRRTGGFVWRHSLVTAVDDNDRSYPSPLITTGGLVVVVQESGHKLVALDATGAEVWPHDLTESVEAHADPVLSAAGYIELPVWYSGIGLDMLAHWISVDAATGSRHATYANFGGPMNLTAGVSLGGGALHAYPEQTSLLLVNSAGAKLPGEWSYFGRITAPPSVLVADNIYLMLMLGTGELPDFPKLGIVLVDPAGAAINQISILPLDTDSNTPPKVYGKPALDSAYGIFCADTQGTLYRATYNPYAGGPLNPQVTARARLSAGDTYYFNSFALGVECAYIVTEQGTLYCIYNALD